MNSCLRWWMRVVPVPTALGLILLLSGCSSDPGPGESRRPAAMHRPPTPPMAGQGDFFDGQIVAEIRVGSEGMPEVGPANERPERSGSGGGRGRRGGGGGFGAQGGGGGMGGNVRGNVPFGAGGEGRRGPGSEGGGAPGPRMGMMGGGRPVMIHLRFTNRSPAPVTLSIDDFTSPLGNFAVRPEKLALDPGQSLETEPMTSQLAGAFTEADATLVLRIGAKAEKKTFHLSAVKPPANAAAETAGPQEPNPPKS